MIIPRDSWSFSTICNNTNDNHLQKTDWQPTINYIMINEKISLLIPVAPRGELQATYQYSPSNSVLSNHFQLSFILFMSASNSRPSVFFGFPLFCLFSGFQVSAFFVIQFDDFLDVCPIHFWYLSLISFSTGSWFILSHSRLLLLVSDQQTLNILRRQKFRNTCTFSIMVMVVV